MPALYLFYGVMDVDDAAEYVSGFFIRRLVDVAEIFGRAWAEVVDVSAVDVASITVAVEVAVFISFQTGNGLS